MLKIINKVSLVKCLFLILSILAFVFLCVKKQITSYDSFGYFYMQQFISSGYPFFLRTLYYLFGKFYLLAAVSMQFVLVISSIYIFVFYFLKYFNLKKYQLIILVLVLFYPIFDSNIYLINNVATEAISFSLFLQVVYLSYLVFIKRSGLIYAFALTILSVGLISIRGQFQFLIPVFIIIELLVCFKSKNIDIKRVVLFLLIPLFTFFVDNVYHKLVHKKYFSTPFTYTALATSVLFLADDSDDVYLETYEQKELFQIVKSSFHNKKINYNDHKYHKEPIDWNYFFYHYEFPTLCNQIIQQEVNDFYRCKDELNILSKTDTYIQTEKIRKEIFCLLLPKVFTKWVGLAIQNFKTGVGGVSIILLYFISLVLALRFYILYSNKIALFSIFLLLLIITNRLLISISIHGLTRYFFYTHWISIFLFFIVVNHLEIKNSLLKRT